MNHYVMTERANKMFPSVTHSGFSKAGWTNEQLIKEGFLIIIQDEIMKLTIHNPPEGYESEVEFRCVVTGEYFISTMTGEVSLQKGTPPFHRLLVLTPKPWQAEPGAYYYVVDTFGKVEQRIQGVDTLDDMFFRCGNYYRTREEAEAVSVNILQSYKNGKV